MELKVKERDQKYKEKVEIIEKLNNEITKMKEEQLSSSETINKLTAMTDQDDQKKIRNAIEAQRNAETKVSLIEEENQKLKKINNDKQTENRKLKELNNKLDESVNDLKAKYEKEYQETITLRKLVALTD